MLKEIARTLYAPQSYREIEGTPHDPAIPQDGYAIVMHAEESRGWMLYRNGRQIGSDWGCHTSQAQARQVADDLGIPFIPWSKERQAHKTSERLRINAAIRGQGTTVTSNR